MAKIARFIPKGSLGTPATVIDALVDGIDATTEIYAVVKYKDGSSRAYVSGDLAGLTFAILILQNKALEALNGQ